MGLFEWLNNDEPSFFGKLLNYENTGQWGEYLTEYLINNHIDGYFKIVKNVYLETQKATTEIDVILIHEKGVFVFESKNYSGWIFGSAEQKHWTQCLVNKEKRKFYNPIMQNSTHIKAIKRTFNITDDKIFSYIVFSERCELRVVPENTEQIKIIKRDELKKKLDKHICNLNTKFTMDEIDILERLMIKKADLTKEEKEKHNETINQLKNNEICPYCKNVLVLRKGKYGDFFGCKSYPKCKYTKKATL